MARTASVAFGDLRLSTVGPSCPMLAPQCRLKNAIAHPYRLRREFNEFLLVDPFQRRVEPHHARRRKPYRLVMSHRPDIRQLLLAANIHRQVGLTRVLAHDHPFIDRFAWLNKKSAALLQVKDSVSAGDTFAGGFLGYLARSGKLSDVNLRRALVYGSVMASFAVEEFGLGRLLRVTRQEIEARFNEFKSMTHFDV